MGWLVLANGCFVYAVCSRGGAVICKKIMFWLIMMVCFVFLDANAEGRVLLRKTGKHE